jgi:hypothetical protein
VISSALAETSSFFFTIVVPSCEGVAAEDGVADGVVGDARATDDDAEREDGGEALADCPGELPSNRRGILRWRPMVFVFMTTNVGMLNGSNPALRRLLIKPRLG